MAKNNMPLAPAAKPFRFIHGGSLFTSNFNICRILKKLRLTWRGDSKVPQGTQRKEMVPLGISNQENWYVHTWDCMSITICMHRCTLHIYVHECVSNVYQSLTRLLNGFAYASVALQYHQHLRDSGDLRPNPPPNYRLRNYVPSLFWTSGINLEFACKNNRLINNDEYLVVVWSFGPFGF